MTDRGTPTTSMDSTFVTAGMEPRLSSSTTRGSGFQVPCHISESNSLMTGQWRCCTAEKPELGSSDVPLSPSKPLAFLRSPWKAGLLPFEPQNTSDVMQPKLLFFEASVRFLFEHVCMCHRCIFFFLQVFVVNVPRQDTVRRRVGKEALDLVLFWSQSKGPCHNPPLIA